MRSLLDHFVLFLAFVEQNILLLGQIKRAPLLQGKCLGGGFGVIPQR
jgi:hypothetical protein